MALVTLRKHQKKTVTTLNRLKDQGAFDTSGCGTGKTIAHLAWYAAHRKKGGACALVIAPRTLLKTAWGNDIEKAFPHLKYSIANANNREKAFKVPVDIYITNTDAATWLAKQPPKFFSKFDTLIIDESTSFKTPTSQRSKAMAKVAKRFKYRRCLTGTPNPNSITEVWHQVFLLDGGKRLGSSFYGFRNSVCDCVQVGANPQAVKWSDRLGAQEAVTALLKDITIYNKLEDVVDMPEHVIYTREFELTPKHLKKYKEMEQMALMELEGKVITAPNAAVVQGKLLQIASGAVYDNRKDYHVVDTSRYELITDLVEEQLHNIVFFFWNHQRDQLVEHAQKAKHSYAVIDGSVGDTERNQIIADFQKGKYKVLFAHPKSAAHGVTLTKATRLIWASPTSSQELLEQGGHRHYRSGQTQRTETIVVIAKDTVDAHAYQVCTTRGDNMLAMLERMKQYYQEGATA